MVSRLLVSGNSTMCQEFSNDCFLSVLGLITSIPFRCEPTLPSPSDLLFETVTIRSRDGSVHKTLPSYWRVSMPRRPPETMHGNRHLEGVPRPTRARATLTTRCSPHRILVVSALGKLVRTSRAESFRAPRPPGQSVQTALPRYRVCVTPSAGAEGHAG